MSLVGTTRNTEAVKLMVGSCRFRNQAIARICSRVCCMVFWLVGSKWNIDTQLYSFSTLLRGG